MTDKGARPHVQRRSNSIHRHPPSSRITCPSRSYKVTTQLIHPDFYSKQDSPPIRPFCQTSPGATARSHCRVYRAAGSHVLEVGACGEVRGPLGNAAVEDGHGGHVILCLKAGRPRAVSVADFMSCLITKAFSLFRMLSLLKAHC